MARRVISRRKLVRGARVIRRQFSREVVSEMPLSLQEKKVIIGRELNLNPDRFNVEFFPDGNIRRVVGVPVEFTRVRDTRTKAIRRGTVRTIGTFIPVEILFDDRGRIVRRIERDTFVSDVGRNIKTRSVFVKSDVNFLTGEERQFKTRSLRRGRESVRLVFKRDIAGRERTLSFEAKDSALGKKLEKQRTAEERELIRKFGWQLERSPKFIREQKIAREKERIRNLFFEQQAQKKLEKLIKKGKVIPGKTGIVSITVGGKRFKFKAEVGKVKSDAERLRSAQKKADNIARSKNIKAGDKFEVDGFTFVIKPVGKGKAVTRDGLVSAVPKDSPKGFIVRTEEGLEKFKKEQQIKSGLIPGGKVAESQIERTLRGNVVLAGVGAAKGVIGVVRVITRPDKFVIGLVEALRPKNFVATLKGEIKSFTLDPAGMIAEYLTFSRGLRLAGTTIKKSPVGKFVQEEMFIRAVPKELRKPVRAVLKSSKVQAALNPKKIKEVKGVDLFEVKSLNKVEANAVRKALGQTDSVIFGSVAGRTLAGKGKSRLPLPKDVDVATRSIGDFNKKFLGNLPVTLRRNYKIVNQKIIRLSDRQALLDVKPISRLIPDSSFLTKRGSLPVAGFVSEVTLVGKVRDILDLSKRARSLSKKKKKTSKDIKKIEGLQKRIKKLRKGIKISDLTKLQKRVVDGALEIRTEKLVRVGDVKLVGFGEQTLRKGLGTLQVLIEKNVRRAKDPQAFVQSLQIQLDALRRSRPRTVLGRLNKRRRIRIIRNALKILTSKGFVRLLEKRVPGITKDFPILGRLDVKKLKKVRKLPEKEIKKIVKGKRPVKKRIVKKKVVKRVVKRKPSKVPSKLPKKRISRIPPSRLPKKKRPSKLPKRRKPSKLPVKRRPSKVPSKLPKKVRISRLPRKVKPSKLPVKPKKPSRLPSRRRPKRVVSRLPVVRKRRIREAKEIRKLEMKLKKEVDKSINRAKKDREFIFLADLESLILGIRAKKGQRAKLLAKGRIFTGLERRPIV